MMRTIEVTTTTVTIIAFQISSCLAISTTFCGGR
jgi:hypothetical protein